MLRSRLLAMLLVAGCVVPAGHAAGQADSLSGLWGRKDDAGLELKFDGRSAVTGTIYITGVGPSPIRTGSFDPVTRRIRLEGEAAGPDGVRAPWVIQGTLEGDRLSLAYDFGGNAGTASFNRAGTTAAAPIVTDAAPALRKQFAQVSGWMSQAAEIVPADKYSYRPSASVRTFGELVGHVIDSYEYSCANGMGRGADWSYANEKGATDKASLGAKLQTATDTCTAAFASGTNMEALVEGLAHVNLHYGNVVTYMRMLGLVPPSS